MTELLGEINVRLTIQTWRPDQPKRIPSDSDALSQPHTSYPDSKIMLWCLAERQGALM